MSAPAPTKILVIHFGQLGDVVLGLPALDAVRSKFPNAHVTALTGTPADEVVRMSGLADRVDGIDRRALKYGSKLRAIAEIARLAGRVRTHRFDLVIDLHAFYETGLLALISGARRRVGPRRENRSLPFAYTETAPPEDRSAHMIDRYLAVARAAGAVPRISEPVLARDPIAEDEVSRRLAELDLATSSVVGLNPGAGWEIRRWPRERFVELGRRVSALGTRVAVFAGPEEKGLGAAIASDIGSDARAMEGLSLRELAAMMRRCAVVVSNDTGPSHISAAAETPTLVLMPGNAGPSACAIRGERNRLVVGHTIDSIPVDEVFDVVREMLAHASVGEP